MPTRTFVLGQYIYLLFKMSQTDNVIAREPQVRVIEEQVNWAEAAERVNGWSAMLGVIAAIGAYTFTGQLIPGIF